jgi:hypothetical protein
MEKKILFTLALAMSVALLGASVSMAVIAVPGQFQDGLAGQIVPPDWQPDTAPEMTEDPNTAGLYSVDISAANLGVGSVDPNALFEFKIIEGTTLPLTWGNVTELTPQNNWLFTDSAGTTTLSYNTNTVNDGFLPTTNRIASSSDAAWGPGFFATGSWMDEAGGTADWDPGDSSFEMTDPNSSGLYSKTVTISTPGAYEWKVTWGDFDRQWGTNGRILGTADNWAFNAVDPNQDITFLLDINKGAISLETATFVPGDTNNDTFVTLADYDPIEANFLNNTFVRSEGDLDGDGVVGVSDFHEWKTAYLAALSAVSSVSTAAVPEPSSLALVLFAGFGAFARRRRGTA